MPAASGFTKVIDVGAVGVVTAEVFGPGGGRVDIKTEFWFCWTTESKLQAAHRWADKLIEQCKRHRVREKIPV